MCAESQEAVSELRRITSPWEENRSGVVSLLDMLRFHAELFVIALKRLHEMENWKPIDQPIPYAAAVAAGLNGLYLDCEEHGLEYTALKCKRIMDDCHLHPGMTYKTVVPELKALRERLEDELGGRVFLSLTEEEGRLFVAPAKGWDVVLSRFSAIRFDIEESSHCFALGRYGAAVFHVLLVAEFGVIQVAKLLHVEGDKPGWGSLQKLENILSKPYKQRSAIEKEHSKFLESLAPMARAMKESWRHKISHVENKLEWLDTDFSPKVASDIITATRGFMERIAKDIPK